MLRGSCQRYRSMWVRQLQWYRTIWLLCWPNHGPRQTVTIHFRIMRYRLYLQRRIVGFRHRWRPYPWFCYGLWMRYLWLYPLKHHRPTGICRIHCHCCGEVLQRCKVRWYEVSIWWILKVLLFRIQVSWWVGLYLKCCPDRRILHLRRKQRTTCHCWILWLFWHWGCHLGYSRETRSRHQHYWMIFAWFFLRCYWRSSWQCGRHQWRIRRKRERSGNQCRGSLWWVPSYRCDIL